MTVFFLFRRTSRTLLCLAFLAFVGAGGASRSAAAFSVHDFAGPFADGAHSVSALVQDAATGDYYGTTRSGGKYGQGTVFHLDPNFGLTVLYSFAGGSDGADPTGTLILVGGVLYGTTLRGGSPDLGTVFRIGTNGSGYVHLHVFVGSGKDGASPYAGVIFTSSKILYGTTLRGGRYNSGTVYSLPLAGGATTLRHEFAGTAVAGVPPDGATPYARLLEYKKGTIVGTTALGGSGKVGTVYLLTLSGSGYVLLHQFSVKDGANPTAELIQATDPAGRIFLLGTTVNGGRAGQGTAYHLTSTGGLFASVYEFLGTADGANPWGGLLLNKDGNLYGTTLNGGAFGEGAVYGLNFTVSTPYPQGIVYSFAGGFSPTGMPDGAHPYDTLIQSVSGGQMYGTTQDEGAHSLGTIFQAP